MREGKLAYVEEPGADGQLRKRVLTSAIEERLHEIGRGPQVLPPTTPDVTAGPQGSQGEGHHSSGLTERLVLAEATASTLRAQLEARDALIAAAIEHLDAPLAAPWWRRRREQVTRLAETAAAIRQLGALPGARRLES
jgi:hypothetical protein